MLTAKILDMIRTFESWQDKQRGDTGGMSVENEAQLIFLQNLAFARVKELVPDNARLHKLMDSIAASKGA